MTGVIEPLSWSFFLLAKRITAVREVRCARCISNVGPAYSFRRLTGGHFEVISVKVTGMHRCSMELRKFSHESGLSSDSLTGDDTLARRRCRRGTALSTPRLTASFSVHSPTSVASWTLTSLKTRSTLSMRCLQRQVTRGVVHGFKNLSPSPPDKWVSAHRLADSKLSSQTSQRHT